VTTRGTLRGDVCDEHQINSEDAQQTAMIDEHRTIGGMRQALQAALAVSAARNTIRRAQRK